MKRLCIAYFLLISFTALFLPREIWHSYAHSSHDHSQVDHHEEGASFSDKCDLCDVLIFGVVTPAFQTPIIFSTSFPICGDSILTFTDLKPLFSLQLRGPPFQVV